MIGLPCGAAEFLRAGGPSAVPFHACCAAALVASANAVHRPGGVDEVRRPGGVDEVRRPGGVDDVRRPSASPFPCAAELLAALATDGGPGAEPDLAGAGAAVGGGSERPS